MATRLQNILTRARDSLADTNGERWSDDRLIRLASEAQQDIAKRTRILKGQASIPLNVGEHTYTLPPDVYELTRATFDDYKIPLVSYNDLDDLILRTIAADRFSEDHRDFFNRIDNLTDRWQTETGSRVEALVFDRRNMDEIRVFPIPDDTIAEATYEFVAGGFLSEHEYEVNSPFGVIVDTSGDTAFNSVYGTLSSAQSINYLITDTNSCSGVNLIQDTELNTVFGFTADITDTIKDVNYYGDELLGVTADIEGFQPNSVFGVVADVFTPLATRVDFTSVYGVMTNFTEVNRNVLIWYIAYPSELVDVNSSLDVPSSFDMAIKHYVVAHAFDDDMDTRYAEKSAKALQYYQSELNMIADTVSRDHTQASQYHNNYKGFM